MTTEIVTEIISHQQRITFLKLSAKRFLKYKPEDLISAKELLQSEDVVQEGAEVAAEGILLAVKEDIGTQDGVVLMIAEEMVEDLTTLREGVLLEVVERSVME